MLRSSWVLLRASSFVVFVMVATLVFGVYLLVCCGLMSVVCLMVAALVLVVDLRACL